MSPELTLKGAKGGVGTGWEGCRTEDTDGPERGLNRLVSTQWRGEWGMEGGEGGVGNDRHDRGEL